MIAAPEAAAHVMTADELLRLPGIPGQRYELAQGELKTMTPASFEHGDITLEIGMRLRAHVRVKRLGRVLAAGTGFRLTSDPDTVRTPDVAFVSEARMAWAGSVTGFFPGAPDLAVEVIAPTDGAAAIQRKVAEYFAAGALQAWVVYPDLRAVVVFRSARESVVQGAADMLDGGEVIPGFTCQVGELFD